MCARRDSLTALGRQIDGLTKSIAAVMAEPPPDPARRIKAPATAQAKVAR